MYESENITADARQSRHGYGGTYSDDSDEADKADEYDIAVGDLIWVDLEAGDIGKSASTCPAGFH